MLNCQVRYVVLCELALMRINQTVILLLVVILPLRAYAETLELPDKTVIRKTIDSSGKITFSKTDLSETNPVNKSTESEVKTPAKSILPKVDIYYAGWDPYSNKAIVFFRENHIIVNAYDINIDTEAATRKKKIDPGFFGMPLVIINGEVIRGVDEKKYREALAIPAQ